jgi:hypothetical protein
MKFTWERRLLTFSVVVGEPKFCLRIRGAMFIRKLCGMFSQPGFGQEQQSFVVEYPEILEFAGISHHFSQRYAPHVIGAE